MNVLKFCRLISKNFIYTEPKELYKLWGRCSAKRSYRRHCHKEKINMENNEEIILKIMNNFNNYRLLKFMIQVKEKNKTNKGTCH